MLKNNIAVQALEWIPRVALAQRPAYEAAARADGYERFGITQRESQGRMISAEEREEYFPVYYVEPYRGNEIALGFDLASNAIRKQALETARNSGQSIINKHLKLNKKIEVLGECLSLFPHESVYTVPAVREFLESFKPVRVASEVEGEEAEK